MRGKIASSLLQFELCIFKHPPPPLREWYIFAQTMCWVLHANPTHISSCCHHKTLDVVMPPPPKKKLILHIVGGVVLLFHTLVCRSRGAMFASSTLALQKVHVLVCIT